MIDLDMLLKAARKPWYCRSEAEENMLSPEFIADASARIGQAEKDAARYRFIKEWNQSYSLNVYRKELWDEVVDKAMWMESQCNKSRD